ncbi:MAG: SagB/ThcOx family dehydrogenase [candidate division WOR-3 bacterium]
MTFGLRVMGYGLVCLALVSGCKAHGAAPAEDPKTAWRAFYEITRIRVGEPKVSLRDTSSEILLPPRPELSMSLSSAIRSRRSRRELSEEPITLSELSALVYYSIGITGESNGHALRAAPSAGALYPTELIVAVHEVEGLEPGLYRYDPQRHSLSFYKKGKVASILPGIAIGQAHAGRGACAVIITSKVQRSMGKYGQRGFRYALIDAGAACENLYLAAEALGLGTVAIGAFGDEALANLLGLEEDELPLLIMPIGHIQER